jgi:hypothetical protein
MRLMYSMVLVFTLLCGQVLAAPASKSTPNEGVFTSVNGKVQVKKTGKKNRAVKKNSTVREGERVSTGKDSTATLRFFDGSELKVSPGTEFRLARLEKLPNQDKAMKFKLLAGKLWAKVQKLTSRKSSFEIEAGGVVCGVRGTEFAVNYNPDNEHVDLDVFDGTVYTDANGVIHNYHGGEQGHFNHGNSQGGPTGQGGNDPGGKGNPALDDHINNLTNGGATNGDNSLTDPSVAGSLKVNVRVNVSPGEAIP